jgi:hypothetical protein
VAHAFADIDGGGQLEALVSQMIARTEREAARSVIASAGGVICTDHLARCVLSDPCELWWWLDMAEPCDGCREDMAEDGEPLAVYRSGGLVMVCHEACYDEGDADPWDEDRWPDYPDPRWCWCGREFTVMQPVPGPNRRYCTATCYEANRLLERRRPPVTHSCLHCGGEFVGRADALTCSARCRQASNRATASAMAGADREGVDR